MEIKLKTCILKLYYQKELKFSYEDFFSFRIFLQFQKKKTMLILKTFVMA